MILQSVAILHDRSHKDNKSSLKMEIPDFFAKLVFLFLKYPNHRAENLPLTQREDDLYQTFHVQ